MRQVRRRRVSHGRVLRQALPVAGHEPPGKPIPLLPPLRRRVRPLQAEDQVVVTIPLQAVHRLLRVLLLQKGDEGEPPRGVPLLVLGQKHPMQDAESAEEVLQVIVRRVFRNVCHSDRWELVLFPPARPRLGPWPSTTKSLAHGPARSPFLSPIHSSNPTTAIVFGERLSGGCRRQQTRFSCC